MIINIANTRLLTNANDYPLTIKYFGKYLEKLSELNEPSHYTGRLINVATAPDDLEKRLNKIEILGLSQSIINEVGITENYEELDKRLINAWAEIRTVDQLRREKYSNIEKTTEISDFVATKNSRRYAFQVTRINKTIEEENIRHGNKSSRKRIGSLDEIYDSYNNLISDFFWNSLERKNLKYKKWTLDDHKKCVVIISSDDELQDLIVRHIACKQIADGIRDQTKLYINDLLWLPDNGNGAWFTINDKTDIHCYVDWKDTPGDIGSDDEDIVLRKELDLQSEYPSFRAESS